MAGWTFLLLPIDVVAQCLVEHSLEVAALAFGDLTQRGEDLGCHLGGEFFSNDRGHGLLRHDES